MDQAPSPPLTQRLLTAALVAIDVLVALLLAAASILATALGRAATPRRGPGNAIRYVAILVACLGLPLRRRNPMHALYLIAPAIVVLVALGRWRAAVITAAFVVYSVAATTPAGSL